MKSFSYPGLIHTKLHNIRTLTLEWGDAAGIFLSIEPLMRYLAEVHPPMRDKAAELLKADKTSKNKKYVNYWDCNPKYLVGAIEAVFGADLSSLALTQLAQYPAIRDKFLHGVFIELMEVLGIEPTSRLQLSFDKWQRLEPGEIYESLWSMKKNGVFSTLRRYANDVTTTLNDLISKADTNRTTP